VLRFVLVKFLSVIGTGGLAMSDDTGNAHQSGSIDAVAAPQGFFERLSNSFGAILLGLACIPLACWGLWVNEGRAVKTARALTEGQGLVQAVSPGRVDPAFNGKLVHVSGDVRSAQGVMDDTFGVRAKALGLRRQVEMHQWVEKETGSGQDRKFVYSREWRDSFVDSSRFRSPQGHSNGGGMPFRGETFHASDARIEAYPVGVAARRLGSDSEFRVDDAALAQARSMSQRRVQIVNGGFYFGNDPTQPSVGDLRVTYRITPEGPASFVGRQAASGLEGYRASNGREILLAQSGLRTPDEMFEKAQDDNSTWTWILRGAGLLGLFIAFSMLFSPVKLLAGYVPVLGSLVSGATSLIAGAATMIVGPVVIALAWFAYRPLVSIIVLVIGLGLAAAFVMLRRKKLASAAPVAIAT
jgi:hypothetical protein